LNVAGNEQKTSRTGKFSSGEAELEPVGSNNQPTRYRSERFTVSRVF